MLAVGWIVAALVAVAVLTAWVTFTLTRLDRLRVRVEAAGATLDAQLVRRAVAVQQLIAVAPGVATTARLDAGNPNTGDLVRTALATRGLERERAVVENALGRAVVHAQLPREPPESPELLELREAAARVLIARRFYNDAVRDARILQEQPLPRLMHRARGRRANLPPFFDIDDAPPPAKGPTAGPAAPLVHHAYITEQDSR